jgi:hypothetical protein
VYSSFMARRVERDEVLRMVAQGAHLVDVLVTTPDGVLLGALITAGP